MMSRIRKSIEDKDQGFTLVELLVVMIIIGILAAIAIPVFMNQRKKAVDSAAVSDVSTLGKEIATYYVDATDILETTDVSINGTGRYIVGAQDVGKVSSGVSAPTLTEGGTDVPTASQHWCVQVSVTGGTKTVVSYSAQGGLNRDGGC